MKLEEAERTARKFIYEIRDCCERVMVAGSIRRMKREVGDIEVVCIPQIKRITQVLLTPPFQHDSYGPALKENILHTRLLDLRFRRVVQSNRVSKDGRKPPFKKRHYRLTFKGCPIDLFCVLPPADWGVILTIRTGPAEYSQWLATEALKRGLKIKDGQLFQVDGARGRPKKIYCNEEADFFKALGLEWIPPEQREVKR